MGDSSVLSGSAISVWMGATAALDILSTERGKPFHDFDTSAAIE
ncbi:hypothetical protein [Haladaptatus halobius]|nr:hypothetical protein [Haladaptatus halobius]